MTPSLKNEQIDKDKAHSFLIFPFFLNQKNKLTTDFLHRPKTLSDTPPLLDLDSWPQVSNPPPGDQSRPCRRNHKGKRISFYVDEIRFTHPGSTDSARVACSWWTYELYPAWIQLASRRHNGLYVCRWDLAGRARGHIPIFFWQSAGAIAAEIVSVISNIVHSFPAFRRGENEMI